MAGYTYTAELIGFDDFKDKLRAAPQMVAEVKREMVERMVEIASDTATRQAPFDTGNLFGNIGQNSKVLTGGGDIFGQVGVTILSNGAPYGIYQEYGTGIYGTGPGASGQPITPKKKKNLAFQINGQWIKTKQTLGIKPKFYMKQGMEAVKARINEIFDVGKKIIDNLK